MMRAKIIFALLLLCLPLGFASPVLADGKQDASAFANDLGHKALAVITDGSSSKDDKQEKLESLFVQYVDIDWIGQFVLGRYWRQANDAQKKDYLTNYRTFIIKHYTKNLSEFTDANFEVTKVVPEDRGGYVVTMHLKRPGKEDTIVDYTVRTKDGEGFKVYDITVEGVSMITTQRSEFNSVASQKGIDYLISQLGVRSKTEDEQGKQG